MSSLRSSNRKQQTRLTFSPLPSSSPTASDYPDQAQRHAAAVRYDHSPSLSKKRRIVNAPPHQTLLTPAKSQGIHTSTNSPQVTIAIQSPESKRNMSKGPFSDETHLPTPVASSQTEIRDERESESEHKLTSTSIGEAKSRTKFDDSGNMTSPIPTRISRTNTLMAQVTGYTEMKMKTKIDEQYISDEDELPLPRVKRRGVGRTPILLSNDDDSDPASAEPVTPRRSKPVSSANVTPLRFFVGGKSGAAPLSDSQRRRKSDQAGYRRRATKTLEPVSPPKRFMRSTATRKDKKTIAEISTDDESDPQPSPGFQPSSTRELRHTSKGKLADTSNATNDAEKDAPKTGWSGRQKSGPVTVISSSSESSDEELVISPRRRRLGKRKVKLLSSDAEDSVNDLKDDLDDLQGTQVLRNRTRTRTKVSERSIRQAQLEVLKRRRATGKTEGQDSRSNADLAANIPQGQLSDDEVAEETADSATEYIRQTLSGGQNLNEYADDDDGFLDDEDATIGAPLGLEEMPLEFTRHGHKKPIEHFKDMVEWMIHNKLNPAFARHDPIYQIAVRKLDDEVQGYSGSKFLSSAWNADFLKALKARPELSRLDVPTMFDHKCDACNRSGHPAKHQLIFSGKPYNRDTLENLTDNDNDEEDDDEDKESEVDESNQEQAFYLGRTCAANAETAHALYHWRNHLNQYVLNWLKNNGHTTPEKIVERENWSTKRRAKYANKVVDGMDESGEMKILYKEFKQNLDIAREARPERFAYGRR